MDCLFCKIVDGTIPSPRVYEDEDCIAIADIHPQAPTHILVIPREHISSLAEATEEDRELLGHLLWVTSQIARQQNLKNGYRTVFNSGDDGGQTVDHLHIHLLGGRSLSWPPG
jgi:histidine triad (HIT) family protein